MRSELTAALRHALRGLGARGAVALRDGGKANLLGPAGAAECDASSLLEQWSLLPPSMRQRRVAAMARELAAVGHPAPATRSAARTLRASILLPALLVLAITALVARSVWGSRLPAPPEARPHRIDTDVGARAEQRTLACEASRARLHAGASTAAFDTEGWVVELWLARAATTELLHHPALTELHVEGRLADGADSYLVPMPDGALDVTSGLSPQEAARSPGWRAVTIRFRGGYVAALQDTAGRASFIALAERLSHALSADLGALYARCAHLGTRDVGVWFRGGDAPGAAAALVHAIGLHADVPVVDRSTLVRPRDDEIETLRAAANRLDVATLARIVVDHGATLKKAPSGPVSLTFAIDQATRALPASRAVGDAMQTVKDTSARGRR